MNKSIVAGCTTIGMLPGKLKVSRRAPGLQKALKNNFYERNHPINKIVSGDLTHD